MNFLNVLLLILSASTTLAITCQEYTRGHCVSVGCDVHCDGIGRGSGYCAYDGSGCTCICTGRKRSSYIPSDVDEEMSLATSLTSTDLKGDSLGYLHSSGSLL